MKRKTMIMTAACAALLCAGACSTITINVYPPCGTDNAATNSLASAAQNSIASVTETNGVLTTTQTKAKTFGSVAVTVNQNTYKNVSPNTPVYVYPQ